MTIPVSVVVDGQIYVVMSLSLKKIKLVLLKKIKIKRPPGSNTIIAHQVEEQENVKSQMNHLMTKPTKWSVGPVKYQISLGIHPVWSESSLCAQMGS